MSWLVLHSHFSLSLLDSTVSPQGHIKNTKNRQPFTQCSSTIFNYLSFVVCRNHNHSINLMRWIFEISKCSAAQLLKLLKCPSNLPPYCSCDGSNTPKQRWTVNKWKGRTRSIPGGPGHLPNGLQGERREGSWRTCMRTREGHQHLGQCSRVKVSGAGRKQEGRAISSFCSKNWDFAVATCWPHFFLCSNSLPEVRARTLRLVVLNACKQLWCIAFSTCWWRVNNNYCWILLFSMWLRSNSTQ